MNDDNLKKAKTSRLLGGGAVVALATWGFWALCGGGFSASSGSESAFDGWFYGREDQKAASAALAAAGLDDWSWDADGRLFVPKNKKSEYQAALAQAGAYPKAPSEYRRDAIREIGTFESAEKTRMRDLDVCAYQLERTLEQIVGIEYATVGVRSRREQSGLTAKTVVTASVGVACREGGELDAELLSAITVATKHHLGVEANENVSILDLRAGKSYFGSEKSVGNGLELALTTEKERVETYWRDKLEKTFDYMRGVRVAVAAELTVVGAEEDERQGARGEKIVSVAGTKRASTAAERLASVEIAETGEIEEIGETKKPRPLAVWDEKNGRNASVAQNGAFARLGNPVASRASTTAVEARNLAEVERATRGTGVLSVGATEPKGRAKRGVVSASYRSENENESESKSESGATARNEADGVEKKAGESSDGRTRFRTRALVVRVGTPRGYVRRVAQNLRAENAGETFANDDEIADWRALYRTTEQKIIEETKNVALALLRPLAEQNGWSEDELARSVVVDVFADPRDVDDRSDFAGLGGGSEGAKPLEVVANFGRVAEVEGTVAEESTGDAEPLETETSSAKSKASELWARWKERARRLDAKIVGGVGGGILTILTLGTSAAGRRRKKRRLAKRREEGEEIDDAEEMKTPVAPIKREKKKTPTTRNGENEGADGINEIDEVGEIASRRKPTNPIASLRNARNGANRASDFGGWNDSSDSSGFGGQADESAFDDDLDDWEDDLLEIRALVERERGRIDGVADVAERRETRRERNEANGLESDSNRRREALDLVAKNPERAAASLRRWIRPGA
ncbi:MAG: hypothetical protein IKU86_05485 [Thermoguttaceae bacterium]|nr:hypothetical protein [Thermoguttaceae bacterium]